jgi:radical SAM protein with 4Fe4S-binding SPASM domain
MPSLAFQPNLKYFGYIVFLQKLCYYFWRKRDWEKQEHLPELIWQEMFSNPQLMQWPIMTSSKAKIQNWIDTDSEMPKLRGWLTINRSCNLKCKWCYSQSASPHDTMPLSTAKISINLMKDLGLTSVTVIGGEPTTHPKLFNIIRQIRDCGMKVILITNGIKLADKNFLKEAIDCGVSFVNISLKGASERSFKLNTDTNLFCDSIKSVRNMVEMGFDHIVSTTVCNNIRNDFYEMIDIVKDTGSTKFNIDVGRPIFLNGKACTEGMWSPRDIAKFFINAHHAMEKSGLLYAFNIPIPFCLFPKSFINEIIDKGIILTGCHLARRRGIVIDPKGRLLTCAHIHDKYIGTIGKNFVTASDFWHYWNSQEMRKFYTMVSSYPHMKCVDCSYWPNCGAGCKLFWFKYGAQELVGNFS